MYARRARRDEGAAWTGLEWTGVHLSKTFCARAFHWSSGLCFNGEGWWGKIGKWSSV